MNNENLWHLQEHIFGYLNYDTLEICRKVYKSWNESLKKFSYIKFFQEFGDKKVGYTEKTVTVSTFIPGWENAVKKYVARASIKDLQEVKDSIRELVRYCYGKCLYYPVHTAAIIGAVKFMDLILKTSYDLNARTDDGRTALHYACESGTTETVELMIKSSKDLSIDLNAKDDSEFTPFHLACKNGRRETVELMIKSSKDFSIDLNARDYEGCTALHRICDSDRSLSRRRIVELMMKNWKEFCIDIKARNNAGRTPLDRASQIFGDIDLKQIKEMLENEYSKIDDTEHVALKP